MALRKLILLVVALAVAGGTVQVTRLLLRANHAPVVQVAQPQAPPVKALRILVAAADLPAGTLIQPAHLRWRAWPAEDGTAAYIAEGTREIQDFAGAVIRQTTRVGDPIIEGRLVKPGERGFLAAVLAPGARAVSVAINGVTGIAGFVFPGDRVDVILTLGLGSQSGADNKERHASETVLSDVRVLALDQRSNTEKGEVRLAQVATLEVSKRQAEAVAVAVEMGRLSLSLRSLGLPTPLQIASTDTEAAPTTDPGDDAHTVTWDRDVSLALAGGDDARKSAAVATNSPADVPASGVRVQVVRGGTATEVTFPQK